MNQNENIMAFLKKILPSKRRESNSKSTNNDLKVDWKKPQFDGKSIRLVLFKDSNTSGRRLIFDSRAIVKLDEKAKRWAKCQGPKLLTVSEGHLPQNVPNQKYAYMQNKTSPDSKWLEEIMFGAVGMAYKGTSLKVHVKRSPAQLMLTKVFVPEKPKRTSTNDGVEEGSSYSSVPDVSTHSRSSNTDVKHSYGQSIPMDVPSPKQHSWLQSIDVLDEDSGLASFTSSGSFYAPSPSSLSDSYNSLNREKRWHRSQTTSLDMGLTRRHSQHDVTSELTSPHRGGKCKFALAIIFDTTEEQNLQHTNRLFESFFFSHIALLESHLELLRQGVERGLYSGGGRGTNFYPIVAETFESFKEGIIDLYTAPRLCQPVWLNMMSHTNHKYVLSEKFLHEFVTLINKFDDKNHKFFMSCLVTSVLTHHLAWVPTVMPAGGSPSGTYVEKHSAKWVNTLAKTHPYNPLWAQLGDLYGAIGFPLKLSRTVIVGRKADLVKKILFVLSYFIRCSDILETKEVGCLDTYLESLDFNVESPCESTKTLPACIPIEEDNLTSSPTPTNINPSKSKFGFDSSKFNPLCVDSLMSNSNSNSAKHQSGDSSDANSSDTQTPICDICRQRMDKVGKSVFYVSNEPCTCDSKGGNSMGNNSKGNNSTGNNSKGSNSIDHLSISSLNSDRQSEIQKKKESLRLGIKIPPPHKSTGNGSVTNGKKLECCLSTVDIVEEAKIERVELGRNCVPSQKLPTLKDDIIKVPVYDIQIPKNIDKVLSMDEIRSVFGKQGSNSMFDEYFEDGSEAKTIDEVGLNGVSTGNRIRFVCEDNRTLAEDEQVKTPSMPDLTAQGIGEGEKKERLRLGSLDQAYVNQTRKSSLSRQISETGKFSTMTGPGRCRSVTPTEYGKRRHISSTSSVDIDLLDPRNYCHELPMPSPDQEQCCSSQKDFDKNFGRSLLADYSDHYLSDFVLHGTSDKNFKEKLLKDIRLAVECSVLDEPIAEAVVVVADTDDFTVNMYSSQHVDNAAAFPQTCMASQLISKLIESVVSMAKLKMSPEFCIMHLEDRLQEIYFKSKMMAEYLKKNKNVPELLNTFGFDRSDLPLLVAIAGTHTPNFPLVCLP